MPRWTVEVWANTGDLGRMGLEPVYTGESLLRALYAMYYSKQAGVKVINLTFRP